MAGRAALRRREAGTGGSLTQPPVVPGRHEDAGTGSSLASRRLSGAGASLCVSATAVQDPLVRRAVPVPVPVSLLRCSWWCDSPVGVSWQLLCLFYLSGGAVVWWSWSGEVEEKKCLITTDGKSPVKRRESQDMGSQSVRKMRMRGGFGESVQLLLLVGLVGQTLAQQPTSEQGEEIISLTFSLRMSWFFSTQYSKTYQVFLTPSHW